MRYHKVEGTPFTIAEKDEKEYYVLMGKYKLTEMFNTPEEALQDAQSISWARIMQFVGIVLEEFEKENK